MADFSVLLVFVAPTDVVYSAMRNLALQRQKDSAGAAPAPNAGSDGDFKVDGEEVEGATGESCFSRMHISCPAGWACMARTACYRTACSNCRADNRCYPF